MVSSVVPVQSFRAVAVAAACILAGGSAVYQSMLSRYELCLSYLRSCRAEAFTLMLNCQLLRAPVGTHEKLICQQCRSRVRVKTPVVSLPVSKSNPPVSVMPHLGVRFTLPL